jgi:hypothetical protein
VPLPAALYVAPRSQTHLCARARALTNPPLHTGRKLRSWKEAAGVLGGEPMNEDKDAGAFAPDQTKDAGACGWWWCCALR